MSDRELFVSQPVQTGKARILKRAVVAITIVVFALVGVMRSEYKISIFPADFIAMLPAAHALLNTLVAACLLGALLFLSQKKYKAHSRCMTAALILSVLFLLSYVAYHFSVKETLFGDFDMNGEVSDEEKADAGSARTVYFVILITHIVAAAVSLPLILMTFVHAWTRDFVKHKKLARKVFPLWLYVAVTGPICYYMLRPFYPEM